MTRTIKSVCNCEAWSANSPPLHLPTESCHPPGQLRRGHRLQFGPLGHQGGGVLRFPLDPAARRPLGVDERARLGRLQVADDLLSFGGRGRRGRSGLTRPGADRNG